MLKPWSEAPRCSWAPFGTIAENEFNVAASWYKPRVGENENARLFYETEVLRAGWSVRQLDRQIQSQFYERTALSRNKAAILRNGATPDGRKTLIIWRKLTGEPEQDNLVLDEWFTEQGYSAKDSEFDLIYVKGGNNLENLKAPDDPWKLRLIEEDFHRLMFQAEGV